MPLLQGYKVLRITDESVRVPMFCHWRAGDSNPAIAVAVEAFESTIERPGENPWG